MITKRRIALLLFSNIFMGAVLYKVIYHPTLWVCWLLLCVYLCGAVTGAILEAMWPEKTPEKIFLQTAVGAFIMRLEKLRLRREQQEKN